MRQGADHDVHERGDVLGRQAESYSIRGAALQARGVHVPPLPYARVSRQALQRLGTDESS